ncbi:MAG: GGDEF and EAL domain-containing protein [Acidimicrobiales bacterium]
MRTLVSPARDAHTAVWRDRLRSRTSDEDRQLQLCQVMWSMRHVVIAAWLLSHDHAAAGSELAALLALAWQVPAHLVVRRVPRWSRTVTLIDAVVLVALAAAGLPPVLVLVMSVGVLGWAATFRPLEAIAVAVGVAAAVAITYVSHGSSVTPEVGVGAFSLLGAIFVVRTVRMNMAARQAAERERLVSNGLDAILWECLPAEPGAVVDDWRACGMKVSAAAERMLGHPAAAWLRPGFFAGLLHPDDLPRFFAHQREHVDGSITIRLREAGGEYRWMEHRATWIGGRDARPAFAVGLLVDRTDQRAADERLRAQARQDELTGLPNRRAFLEVLDTRLADPDGRCGAVVILDLDEFKDINDSLGHEMGDQLLHRIGRTIVEQAGPRDVVARLGGDEFALLLCGEGPAETIASVERLVAAINRPVLVGDLRLRVRASAGVVPVSAASGCHDASELLRCADVAMYEAKRRGSGVEVYDRGTDVDDRQRFELAGDLEHAIVHEQLVLHHQPIYDVATGRMVGTEALARWEHPRLGLVPPDDFIALAEVSGQIRGLTRWVIRRALDDLLALGDAGRDLEVSVNLSVRNLYEVDLVDWVAATLRQLDVAPSRLVVEITESTVMDDQLAAIEVIEGLRRLGVRTWIDDFGTGHSSFARLRTLPVDGVKIDRAFVSGSQVSSSDRIVLRSMVELVGALGMHVVAEGVEDLGTMHLLRELHCDLVQGFALHRPMPFDELQALVERRVRQARRSMTALAS